MKKTIIYVDGLNLYYFLKKIKNQKGIKWLDLSVLLKKIFKDLDIIEIKFFAARVSGKRDQRKALRQSVYFRALNTIKNLKIIEGTFLEKESKIQITEDVKITGKTFEEKGTDVNLAVHLVNDAHNKKFETAIVVSNDSDLKEAVRIVSEELNLRVGILAPAENINKVLSSHATFKQELREGVVRDSQFSINLKDNSGEFTKPETW